MNAEARFETTALCMALAIILALAFSIVSAHPTSQAPNTDCITTQIESAYHLDCGDFGTFICMHGEDNFVCRSEK